MTTQIQSNLGSVRESIIEYGKRYNRDVDHIKLLAVSKTFPESCVRQAYEGGQRQFGENYVDEALEKIQALKGLDIEWHYIGPVQSNKTRKIAEHFDWVQSLASEKHARRLNEQRPEALPALNVCIQVNINHEQTKSGLRENEVDEFAQYLQSLGRISLRGIMGIPQASPSFDDQRKNFNALASIYGRLASKYPSVDTLSIGMSGDMEAAIAEGSTMVRIGTAIFGQRKKPANP